MKLRTRLFLSVGLIFFLAFAVSLYFETYSTDKNLKKAEKNLQEQILSLNEQRRLKIQEFLHVSLSEDQAQIDSLLLQIARDPDFAASLFLDPAQLKLFAPAHAAFLFKNDQWVDLIQTTKDNQLSSLLIPISFPMDVAHQVPIDEAISWVVFNKDRELDHPFIAIKLPISPLQQKSLSSMINQAIEVEWALTILFNPEALLSFAFQQSATPPSDYGIDGPALLKRIENAIEYLKNLKEKEGSKTWIQKDIREKGKETLFAGKPLDTSVQCIEHEGAIIDDRVVQLMQRADQAILLSILTSLFPGGEFGPDLFARGAPRGIARFTPDTTAGHAILTDEAFFQKKVFDDAAYFKKHPGTEQCKRMGTSIAVISPPNMERVFIGNALKLQDKGGTGYVTIAIDMEEISQDLVLSSHLGTFLVHGGKVISAYTADGKKIPNPKEEIPFNVAMLASNSGVVQSKGTGYYYQKMTPFQGLDLHFFTFDLEKNAFSLVHTIDQESRIVLEKVSFNMRIIAFVALVLVLLLLHNIARRISRPIAALARVTKKVAAGQLEDIEIPSVGGRNDEVAALCDSFSQMIIGLREKEKVKGVLNKVVSPEIAQEIMKGQVHLGGEMRKVTVLFADIRNFTNISANREPQRVIEMLNACMTKISHVIDEFGGVIDKYVGDEVMALFGAPLEKEDSALKAIQCALKMVEELKNWNEERKKEGRVPIEMGIGIHTGEMIIGNMGAENRLNYTVIGSNVNFAARLCSVAKGMEILISKETLAEAHVQDNIQVEMQPPIELKGFEGKFALYRVLGVKNV